MSAVLPDPDSFDALALAAGQDTLSGGIDARSLSRVNDRLAEGFDPSDGPNDRDGDRAGDGDQDGGGAGDEPAMIAWRIEGGVDEHRRPALTIGLEGVLPLVCQRCLGALAWPVDEASLVLLARNDGELAQLDEEEPEVILANTPLSIRALVEDELLLSLPFAPRHAADACAPVLRRFAPEPSGSVFAPVLAKLAALKKD